MLAGRRIPRTWTVVGLIPATVTRVLNFPTGPMHSPLPAARHEPAHPGAADFKRPVRRTTLIGRMVLIVSLANFAGVLTLLVLLCLISEEWWLGLALSYLPRVGYLIPAGLLLVASLLVRPRVVWLNLLSALLVLGPIMGLRLPWAASAGDSQESLTVISYNVQSGGSSIESILAELTAPNPDVIVLQEATSHVQLIKSHFADWHSVHAGEYFVASRWPVTMKDACRTEAFGRATAILCAVDAPGGEFLVCNLHHTTARYGLAQLRLDSPLSGRGVEALEVRQDLRASETFETRSFVADVGLETPLLVMGDFNMPSTSSLFQAYWGGMTSAFDAAGLGYGYTSPCNTGSLWPNNTPWLRIDHILLSRHWGVERAWIGRTNGSDHRPIIARIHRRPAG